MSLILFLGMAVPGRAATFYGDLRTGLQELSDYRYPVYLFVPESYAPGKDYPMVLAFPADGRSPEDQIKEWAGLAAGRELIVLVPELKMREGEIPYRTDEWLLQMKRDIVRRYRVAKDRLYLVGTDTSAHYAAYLGMKYPEEFTAVALLGRAWNGPFEKLTVPNSRPRKQVPFFIALNESDPYQLQAAQQKAGDLKAKGYPVYMETLQPYQNFVSADFKGRLLTWLQEEGEGWNRVILEKDRTVLEKFLSRLEGLFRTAR